MSPDKEEQHYEEEECPVCNVMAPAKQIQEHGQCERHLIEDFMQLNKGEKVRHSISIVEDKWKPAARQKGVNI